jgi:arylsulfatase A-like enzyme
VRMATPDKRPNVVVVMTTQWRAQASGYGGDGNAATPFLDSLAEESVDFFQAVTPHPMGVFARAAFLTGVPCPENGVADYFDSLPRDSVTFAHRFQEGGYDTAFFGKWQLYDRDRRAPLVGSEHALIEVPEDRRGGFQFWEGFESGFLLNHGYYHGTDIGPPTRIEGYQSDVIAERWSRYLQSRRQEDPLFAWISLDAPHPPYGETPPEITPRPPSSIVLAEEVPEDPSVRETARQELTGYYGHIEATDRAIGRMREEAKRHLDCDNTIFIFTSAHGDMHGSHGHFRKGWPHEESVRVPLLLSWPNGIKSARRDPLLISLLDLGPSLWGLCFPNDRLEFASENSGKDLSLAALLKAEGPERQIISMPSVVPFDKQCPCAWRASRRIDKTEGVRDDGTRFTLDH